jgi:enamine deaminase RidA (YjgF/YER057c/UK114 family)
MRQTITSPHITPPVGPYSHAVAACSTVAVAALPLGARVEIECVAVR